MYSLILGQDNGESVLCPSVLSALVHPFAGSNAHLGSSDCPAKSF